MKQRRRSSVWLLGLALVTCLVSSAAGVSEIAVQTGQRSHPGPSESRSNSSLPHHEPNITGIAVVHYQWHHVQSPFLVTLWILVAGMAKMGM